MKLLYVSSGNSGKINSIVKAQGDSLKEIGIDTSYFLIDGKGIFGYLKNIPKLRKDLRNSNYDIIHAHYSLSAYVASLAGAKPLVVSLMGSDVKSSGILKMLVTVFAKYIWNVVIAKSEDMRNTLGIGNIKIIPNGVDIKEFKPLDKFVCQKELKWDKDKIHILFAADPEREVKNYALFNESVRIIKSKNQKIVVHFLKSIPHQRMPIFMNAADVVCLTSRWEGSPNVIKEAMACNRPIVSTNVGDVERLTNGVAGCFVSSMQHSAQYSEQLQLAIEYSGLHMCSKGRDRIIDLELDAVTTAKKIRRIYERIA